MGSTDNEITKMLNNVSASSAGGSPFLLAYGMTFIVTAILSYIAPRQTSALIAMFQGMVALPAAFWLENRMGWEKRDSNSPLAKLSGQLAISQALMLPALIVAYIINPGFIPLLLAGIGGMHFFPYAWLHRTRVYIVVGVVIAIGAFVLQLLFGTDAYHYNLILVGVAYLLAAPLVYRNAAGLAART